MPHHEPTGEGTPSQPAGLCPVVSSLTSLPARHSVVIEQAKGYLMAFLAVDADTAFILLDRQAARRHQRVAELAAALVEAANSPAEGKAQLLALALLDSSGGNAAPLLPRSSKQVAPAQEPSQPLAHLLDSRRADRPALDRFGPHTHDY